MDKSLIVLSTTSGSISIAPFDTVIGTLVRIANASLSLRFSLTKNKNKNHNNIVMLARSKLNSIENKISEVLINNQTSQEHFMTIVNGERDYRELKERIIMIKGQELKENTY